MRTSINLLNKFGDSCSNSPYQNTHQDIT
jgi:hypothetical protein